MRPSHLMRSFSIPRVHVDIIPGKSRWSPLILPTTCCLPTYRTALQWAKARASAHSAVNDVFVGEIIGGERLRCADIIKHQPWMVQEDRLWRHTGAEVAQNQLYRNACATNYRFTAHDVRVHFDTFVLHGILFDRSRPQDIIPNEVCQRSRCDHSSITASTNPAGPSQPVARRMG